MSDPAAKTPLQNLGKKRTKANRSRLHRMTSARQENVSYLISNFQMAVLKP